jgi:effector-binding domain-containing protein
MPLDAIQAVLRAPTPAAMDTLLHEHQQRIAARIASDQQTLRLLQQLIDHHEEDLAFTVQVKELPPQPIASIRVRATPAEEERMIPGLLDELQTYTAHLGVRYHAAPPIRISHEYSEEMVDSEIAVPITCLVAGGERVISRVLEGGPAAYALHVGPHAGLWAVYWAILVWVQEHGYERNGPPREVYWMDPGEKHSSDYRTEVLWPVQ